MKINTFLKYKFFFCNFTILIIYKKLNEKEKSDDFK